MTYFKSLTEEQKIEFIILLQKSIRNKFKYELVNRIISGNFIKKEIIDNIVWDNQDKHLYKIKKLVYDDIIWRISHDYKIIVEEI